MVLKTFSIFYTTEKYIFSSGRKTTSLYPSALFSHFWVRLEVITHHQELYRLCKNGSKVAVLYSPVFQSVVAVRLSLPMHVSSVFSPLVGFGCNFVCHFCFCFTLYYCNHISFLMQCKRACSLSTQQLNLLNICWIVLFPPAFGEKNNLVSKILENLNSV